MEKIIERHERENGYWLGKLHGNIVMAGFPIDFEKNRNTEYKAGTYNSEFSSIISERLLRITKNSEYGLYIFLLSVVKSLLYKLGGSENILVGMPFFKEGVSGVQNKAVLPLLSEIKSSLTFREVLSTVKQTVTGADEHRDCSFENIAGQLKIKTEEIQEFKTIVLLENIHDANEIQGMEADTILSFILEGNSLKIKFIYNSNLFSEQSIEKLADRMTRIIASITEEPDTKISGICIISEEEKNHLLFDLNDTFAQYPQDKTIHQLFEEQAEKSPDSIALVFEDTEITYRELNNKANQIAGLLRDKGLERNDIVGILVERSPEMIYGALGVLKAGGAYLPIDPGYPEKRISSILNDSNAKFLLTADRTLKNLSFSRLRSVEQVTVKALKTGARPQIREFDKLPIPDRTLIDYEKYSRSIGLAMVKNFISIQGTRGCPYQCAYCHSIWPKSHIMRSAENIFNEVKLYYDLGIRKFAFIDDVFNLHKENSGRFFKMVIDSGMKIQIFFPNGLRGDILNKEYIDLMIEAGTVNFALALETASPRLQKLIGKNLNLDKFRENAEYIAQKYPHVIMDLFSMVGFPTETEEEAMMTLNFIKSIKWFHFPFVHVLKIYPGTNMEAIALGNGVRKEDIERSIELRYHELPETLPFSKEFVTRYQSEFLEDYFFNKERLLKVLPYQMAMLAEDELCQKYDSYLPVDIKTFSDLLDFVGISRDELQVKEFIDPEFGKVVDFNEKARKLFPVKKYDENALRILFLDLSILFRSDSEKSLRDLNEQPLGHMYLATYLYEKFGSRVYPRVAKARMDFDSYDELKALIDDFKPDVIGLRTLTLYKDFLHKTASILRQWGIEVPIIVGGPYGTSSYERILTDRNIDLAALGEGEETLAELVEKIMENGGKLPDEEVLKTIRGIAFVENAEKQSGKVYDRSVILMDRLAETENKNPENINTPGDLAYVIYTSGSTGNSKGVMIEHKNVVRLMFNSKMPFDFTNGDVWTMFHSFSFDFSVWEMYGALLYGGRLIIVPKLVAQDTGAFVRLLKDKNVTILNQTPSAFYNLINTELKSSDRGLKLRYIIFGGEALKPGALKGFREKYPSAKLINMYGITETTVHVTYKELSDNDIDMNISNIGKPIPTLTTYVVDRDLNLVPASVEGELLVGGDGVARGYLNRPELNAERFIQNPCKPSERVYRSGDLVKMLPDGDMQYLGRIDQQVKIRGFRIELGEIEHKLLNYCSIREAVVDLKTDPEGNKFLCAYIVSDENLGIQQIREYLSTELPDYMIPSYFVQLERLPLTDNGKVNRKALPNPDGEINTGTEYAAPRNEIEEKLAGVWKEVLKVQRVGINDNFFSLGGDSIKAVQIMARLQKHQLKLEMGYLFQYPTIGGLSEFVKVSGTRIDQGLVTGEVELSPVQEWFFEKKFTDMHHFNQAFMLYRKEGFNKDILEKVFTGIVEHHDALRMVYRFEDGKVIQYNRGLGGKLFTLDVYDLAGEQDYLHRIEVGAAILQAGIDMSEGPLVKLGLFKTDEGDHLLIVIHHLVMDTVSWRIIFEDIVTGYAQAVNNTPVKLEDKTSSYMDWARELKNYAGSKKILKEIKYWTEVENTAIKPLPRDGGPGENRLKDSTASGISLSGQETENLLKRVNKAYNTEINDILLLALAYSIANWTGSEKILVNMEGHGREEIVEGVNITRTIGWFTSMFPVIIDISKPEDVSYQIKSVKEAIRQIPNKGACYSVLKYLTPEQNRESLRFLLKPEICLNYLGQFDGDVDNELFVRSNISTGPMISMNSERQYALDIIGYIVGGELFMDFSYNRNEFKEETIKRLAEDYKHALQKIIDHCMSRETAELTPSDVGYKGLTIKQLEDITKVYTVKD